MSCCSQAVVKLNDESKTIILDSSLIFFFCSSRIMLPLTVFHWYPSIWKRCLTHERSSHFGQKKREATVRRPLCLLLESLKRPPQVQSYLKANLPKRR